jgi:hypothetical protein
MVGFSPRSSRSFSCSLVIRSTGTGYSRWPCDRRQAGGAPTLERSGRLPLPADRAVRERRASRFQRRGPFGRSRHQHGLFIVDGPSIRSPAAVDAAQEDGAGSTCHPVVMTSRQVAVQPVPNHKASILRPCNLLITQGECRLFVQVPKRRLRLFSEQIPAVRFGPRPLTAFEERRCLIRFGTCAYGFGPCNDVQRCGSGGFEPKQRAMRRLPWQEK